MIFFSIEKNIHVYDVIITISLYNYSSSLKEYKSIFVTLLLTITITVTILSSILIDGFNYYLKALNDWFLSGFEKTSTFRALTGLLNSNVDLIKEEVNQFNCPFNRSC